MNSEVGQIAAGAYCFPSFSYTGETQPRRSWIFRRHPRPQNCYFGAARFACLAPHCQPACPPKEGPERPDFFFRAVFLARRAAQRRDPSSTSPLQVDSNSLSPVPKKRTMHKSAAPSEIPVQLKLRTPAFLLAPIWEGRGPVLPAPYPARSFYSIRVQGGENVSTFLIPTCYRSSPGPSRSCSTP